MTWLPGPRCREWDCERYAEVGDYCRTHSCFAAPPPSCFCSRRVHALRETHALNADVPAREAADSLEPAPRLEIVAAGGMRVRRDTGEIVATVRDVELSDAAYFDELALRFAHERAIGAVRAIERRRRRDRARKRRRR